MQKKKIDVSRIIINKKKNRTQVNGVLSTLREQQQTSNDNAGGQQKQIDTSDGGNPNIGLNIKSKLRTVFCPIEAVEMFITLAEPNTSGNKETCGYLAGTDLDDQLLITAIIIPPQSGTADSCTMNEEEKVAECAMDRGLTVLGWIHTHP